MIKGLIFRTLLSLGLGMVASASSAAMVTLQIDWSGSGGASATGFITIDPTQLPRALGETSLPSSAVSALQVTISGEPAGNGTFGIGSFESIAFNAPGPLDLGMELIGQDLGNGCTFGPAYGTDCDDGDSGDFNLFGKGGTGAPEGVWFFALSPSCNLEDECADLIVTSIRPASGIPEPGSVALIGLGLAGLAWLRRTRQ